MFFCGRIIVYMLEDPTLSPSKIETPGWGVQGKTRRENIFPPGAPLENSSRSHQTELDKEPKNGEIILRSEFDTDLAPEDLSYLQPASLAKKLMSKTQYDPKYCQMMLEFFLSREKKKEIREDYVWRKTGEVSERYRVVANPPPMFSEFGRSIGVSEKTLISWAKNHPEFGEAYEICQDIIQEFMIENGLSGEYSSQFGIFTAKNITKMKDVQVNKNENYDMKSILDAIEKGQHGIN